MLRKAGYDVSTIYEYQGKQAKNIIIVRVSTKAKEEIYNSDAHILAAISRHTETLTYYTPVRDNVKTLIENPLDTTLMQRVKLSLRGGAVIGLKGRPVETSNCIHVNT